MIFGLRLSSRYNKNNKQENLQIDCQQNLTYNNYVVIVAAIRVEDRSAAKASSGSYKRSAVKKSRLSTFPYNNYNSSDIDFSPTGAKRLVFIGSVAKNALVLSPFTHG